MRLRKLLNDTKMVRMALLITAGLFGTVGLLLTHGFGRPSHSQTTAEVCSGIALLLFLAEQVLSAATIRPWRRYLLRRWPFLIWTALLLGEIAVIGLGWQQPWLVPFRELFSISTLTQAYLVAIQFYIFGVLAVHLPYLHARFARLRILPGRAFLLVFLVLILCGSGLLLLPRATPAEHPIGVLDALFTATSAVCVTGLIVRDTATEFTRFGQTIILALIQVGGLGIMSLAGAFGLLLGRGIGLRESSLLREVFQLSLWDEVGRQLRFIVVMTFSVELIGAAVLYHGLGGVITDRSDRLFAAVFHAVSAFCNAGFSTFSGSLTDVAQRPEVVATVSGLLIVGGLGFVVAAQVLAYLRGRLTGQRPPVRLGLQTGVVLRLSLVLLLVGALLLALIEWNGAFAGRSWGGRLSLAFFQSATCRTAGFNTVDLTALSVPSLFMMMILMFIGGAPGSTAGGVKVTALAVIWANLKSLRYGSGIVRLADREIDPMAVNRALLVVSSWAIAAAVALFVLLVTEGAGLLTTAFEVCSALGTVGLSLGLTPELSAVGRLVVIVLMFVGRLGPLTLAHSLVGDNRGSGVRLPRARMMIG